VAYAAGLWLQLAIVARVGGPAGVGAYAYALALTAPIMGFGGLQLRSLLATDVAGTFGFREYRTARMCTTGAAIMAIAALGLLSAQGASAFSILAAVGVMRAADALSDIYYGLWQRSERLGVVGWGMTLNSLSSTCFMATSWLLGAGVVGAAIGGAMGSTATLAFLHLVSAADGAVSPAERARVSWQRVRQLVAGAAPLGLIVLLGTLQANVPRYFIEHHSGEAALGLFAAASQLTSAGGLVVAAVSLAASPRFASLWAAGDTPSFRTLSYRLVLLGGAIGVVGVVLSALVGRHLLALLFRPEFAAGQRMLVVLSVAAGLSAIATFLGNAMTAARIIAPQPVLLAVALLVLVACCAVLVPREDGDGAAWAVVAGSAVQAAVSWLALGRWRSAVPGLGTAR
jgi:O-antigen/teichoic acid export membrane protein